MLEKGFLKNKTILFELSKRRLVIGLILLLFLSILFFHFFHLLRIGFIFIHASLFNDFETQTIMLARENFYKFLLGFVAIYFSFSIVFDYWFNRPKKFLSRFNYKRKFILNQQRVTNWFFLHWFFRIFMIFGMVALDFPEANLYSDYYWTIILFFFVFYAQMWLSVRQLFKVRKVFWFFFIALIVGTSSFLVSKTSYMNLETVKTAILRKNMMYKNNIHIVESEVFTQRKHRYLSCDIVIPNKEANQVIFFSGERIHEKELESKIQSFWAHFSEGEIPYINHTLFVDKNIKMKFIFDLKKRMNKIGVEKASFSVKKKNSKQPFYHKSKYVLTFNLANTLIEEPATKEGKYLNVKIATGDYYEINGKSISKKELIKFLKEYYQKEGTHSVKIFFNKSTLFEEYFKVFEHSKKAIDELREELSRKGYGVSYSSLNRELKKPIKEKYFWHVTDILNP